jgi:F-type H+-transporting ATPase subunit b
MPSPETWVALAFISFVGVAAYLGARRKVIDRLDRHQVRIKGELDEAIRLREDAQALLSELQAKALAAENEAEAIIAAAKAEAERFAGEARLHMEQIVALRTRIAEAKIAQAEVQALAEVRTAAADVAIAVAEKILRNSLFGASKNSLLAQGVWDRRLKLNRRQPPTALDAANTPAR